MEKQNLEEKQQIEKVTVQPAAAKDRKVKKIAFMVASWILALFIVFAAVCALGIYRFNWSGPAIKSIETIIPYPAAIINGRILTLRYFDDLYDARKREVTYNTAFDFNDPSNAPLVKQERETLLDRMVDIKLEEILAAKKGVTVTADDIEKEMQALYQQTGSTPEEIEQLLSSVYGWTKRQFIDNFVTPQIRENKLKKSVVADRDYNQQAYALAKEVKDKLASGGDFAALAKQYSVDSTTKNLGGDLGWAGRGMYVPEFEQAVFAMQPGQVSEILPSQFGLHIIQQLESKNDSNGQPQVHARHILISTLDFAQWLSEQRAKATVWKFLVN